MDSLFSEAELPRASREIYPGCVHFPGWLSTQQQRYLIGQFFRWGKPGAGIPPHSPEIFGKKMSVCMTTLGWHWSDYQYRPVAEEFDGAHSLEVPGWLQRLGRRALVDAFSPHNFSLHDVPSWPGAESQIVEWANSYTPDVALVNYYAPESKMGMHQDKDERSSAPVVSISLGNTGVFRAGNTENKNLPYEDVLLASGDLVVFGGPSRFMFHGVPKIFPGTSPSALSFPQGRINITLRETGLERSFSH